MCKATTTNDANKSSTTFATAAAAKQNTMPTNFTYSAHKEPHGARHREILAKHPEIKKLVGPDVRLFPSIVALIVAQVSLAIFATRLSFGYWIVLAYTVGGTLTHWLSLGNHELSHNLCFKKPIYNTMLGMAANLAQGIPSFTNFCKYHLEHHYHQGARGKDYIDVDVPSDWEGRVFNSRPRKVLWVFLQPLFYAVRPLWMNPKPHTLADTINMVTTLGFDAMLIYFYGVKCVLFNAASTLLGMGLHPVAGHFIAEHYTLTKGQETYSYYGILNWCAFNVGYHNEHHDFPRVAGFNLPQITKIAPEYYNNLASYDSWVGVIYDYIMRPDIGPCSRVVRE